MRLKIYKPHQQADGSFNGGEIMEKKPIGFPQDGGPQKPFSNLFYWAHARAEADSTIAEHPHQGFEIVTFVLDGVIEHFDDHNGKWVELQEGDVQIMQAGSGLTHAEHMREGAVMFQIWFDPDINRSISDPPFYKDFRENDFPVLMKGGYRVIHYTAKNSPFRLKSEQVDIRRFDFNEKLTVNLPVDGILSMYVIGGNLEMGGALLEKGDFFILKGEGDMEIKGYPGTDLFSVFTPVGLTYETYAQKNRLNDSELES